MLKLDIPTFAPGSPIADEHCFLVRAETGYVQPGPNMSPELRWSGAPEETRSFAVVLVDPDAPTVPEDVNREGTTIALDAPRTDFHHWVLVDVPAGRDRIRAGAESQGIVPGGKPDGPTDYGIRGRNDFTSWFADDPEMGGVYGGYDGPAPPWNDERLHHYHFRLFALDVPTLGFDGPFGARDALGAMSGHVLAEAERVCVCTLYVPESER